MNGTAMDFEHIVLKRSELRQLHKAAKTGKAPLEESRTLTKLKLMTEEKRFHSGYAPESTGFAEINDLGKAYLQYISRRTHEHRVTRWLSIIALAVSILALVLQVLTQLRTQ